MTHIFFFGFSLSAQNLFISPTQASNKTNTWVEDRSRPEIDVARITIASIACAEHRQSAFRGVSTFLLNVTSSDSVFDRDRSGHNFCCCMF